MRHGGFPFRLLLRLLAVGTVLALALLRPQSAADCGWTAVGGVIAAAALAVSVVVHEAGHALVAAALGLEVMEIRIGIGHNLARSRIGAVEVWWNAVPLGGAVVAGARGRRWVRSRYWLMVLAGPLTNVALGAGAFLAGVAVYGHGSLSAASFDPFAVVGYVNVVVAVTNLLPRGNSDGAQLLLIPFRPNLAATLAAVPYVVRAERARRAGDLGGAAAIVRDGLVAVPGAWALRNSEALVHLDRGEIAAAQTVFRTLLDRPEIQRLERALLENNLAWVDLLIGGDAALAEADALSASALRAMRAPSIHGTRGAVLAELGYLDDARVHLRIALAANSDPLARSCNAASLAIVEARAGRAQDARDYLALARSLHGNHVLLPRAAAAVAALPERQTAASGSTGGTVIP